MTGEGLIKNNDENKSSAREADLSPFDVVRHAELRDRLSGETNLLTPREAEILKDVFDLEDGQQEDVYGRVYDKIVAKLPEAKPETIKGKIHQLSAKGELMVLVKSDEISEDDRVILREYLAQLDEINKPELQPLAKKYNTTRDDLRRTISRALKKLRREDV